MDNFLESYLVRIGFAPPDEPGLRTVRDFLHHAEMAVDQHSSGIAKTMFRAQSSIIGTFLSVSGAIGVMAENVAMADQKYRLMGMRMLMTKDTARELDMVTKTLGASIEEITWDPELHERAVQLDQDIKTMTAGLGDNFDKNMVKIRDLRMEFGRLEIAGKFLGMSLVSSLVDSLPMEEIHKKLKSFVDYFESKAPAIGKTLATDVKPILVDTWHLLEEMGKAGKKFGTLFVRSIGLISGDKGLANASLSLHSLSSAFEHVVGWADKFLHIVTTIETWVGHGLGFLSKTPEEARESLKSGLRGGQAIKDIESKLPASVVTKIEGWLAPETAAQAAKEKVAVDLTDRGLPSDEGAFPALANKLRNLQKQNERRAQIEDLFRRTGVSLDPSVQGRRASDNTPASTQNDPVSFNSHVAVAQAQAQAQPDAGDFVVRAFEAIKKLEGYYPPGTKGFPFGSHSYRDKNPGNLRSDPATPDIKPIGSDDGYLVFGTYDEGTHAALGDISDKIFKQGLNAEQFFEKYAPTKDKNNPHKYAADFASALHIDTTTPLKDFADKGTSSKGAAAYMERPVQAPESAPAQVSITNHVEVGDIIIQQPKADLRDIHGAVSNATLDALERDRQNSLTQINPDY